MALSAATNRLRDALSRLLSLMPPTIREVVIGLLAIGSILFALTSQPPEVFDASRITNTVVRSEGATETMHVRLPDGSFSDSISSETTVATTTKE